MEQVLPLSVQIACGYLHNCAIACVVKALFTLACLAYFKRQSVHIVDGVDGQNMLTCEFFIVEVYHNLSLLNILFQRGSLPLWNSFYLVALNIFVFKLVNGT